jgi:hypothetical protein
MFNTRFREARFISNKILFREKFMLKNASKNKSLPPI